MKGNKKILAVAVLLLLITVTFATYAIYRESTTATGTISAAAWSVQVDGDTFANATYTVNLSDLTCSANPGKAGTIAPGATCYKDFAIDADGSQVDVVVEGDVTTTTGSLPENMTISLGTTAGVAGPVTIPYSPTDGDMESTVRLSVVWPGTLGDDSAKDTQDIADAIDSGTISFTLTARQALS